MWQLFGRRPVLRTPINALRRPWTCSTSPTARSISKSRCLLAQAAHEYGQASAETALLRAYLLALKAASVVLLRLGQNAASRARLRKLAALDQRDQFGAARLLAVADAFEQDQEPQLTPAAA